jgi:DNA processing protein
VNKEDIKYWVGFNIIPGIGRVKFNQTEALLLKKLGAEPIHIDEICRASGLPVSAVSSTMAMMELKGMVKQIGTMNYSLCREAMERYSVEID